MITSKSPVVSYMVAFKIWRAVFFMVLSTASLLPTVLKTRPEIQEMTTCVTFIAMPFKNRAWQLVLSLSKVVQRVFSGPSAAGIAAASQQGSINGVSRNCLWTTAD
jgi:hypothetical protein